MHAVHPKLVTMGGMSWSSWAECAVIGAVAIEIELSHSSRWDVSPAVNP